MEEIVDLLAEAQLKFDSVKAEPFAARVKSQSKRSRRTGR